MYTIKGSQTQITPKEFVEDFYKYGFDAYGLQFEKSYGDIAVSLKFHNTFYYPSIDEPLYEAIGLFSGASDSNTDCSIIIYIDVIKTIWQRYRAFKDNEIGVIHKNYEYIFVMSDGKELKFECHQKLYA